MTNENHNDEKTKSSINEKFRRWIVAPICFVVLPIGLVYLLAWLLPDLETEATDTTARNLLRFLAQLPMEPWFYALVIVPFGGYLTWKWYRYTDLNKEFNSKEKKDHAQNQSGLTGYDWSIARELRKRAFVLRVQANLIMGLMFVLLFGGLYAVIYVLPDVGIYDERLAKKREFERRFGRPLNSIAAGRYWLKTDEVPELFRTGPSRITDWGLYWTRSSKSLQLVEDITGLLKPEEVIKLEIFNRLGNTGLVAGDKGSVLRVKYWKTDRRKTWETLAPPLKEEENITVATLNLIGHTVLVAGDKGSVLMTESWKNEEWKKLDLALKEDEFLTVATFNISGDTILVAGNKGSVYMKEYSNEAQWKKLDLALKEDEFLTVGRLSKHGGTGLVVSNRGSALMRRDRGKSWEKLMSSLQEGEVITVAALSLTGDAVLVAGDKGSVCTTTDAGQRWASAKLPLESKEAVTEAGFSEDGKTGLVVSNKGSAFMTRDGGKQWKKLNLTLKDNEVLTEKVITAVAIGANDRTGLVVGINNWAFMTTDGGQEWKEWKLDLAVREQIAEVAFSADGKSGLVGGEYGSVFQTTDGGQSWTGPIDELLHRGRVTAVALSGNGKIAVAAGERGSVFRTTDGGQDWTRTEGLGSSPLYMVKELSLFPDSVMQIPDTREKDYDFIAKSKDGQYYRLQAYPELKEWRQWIAELPRKMMNDKDLRESSIFEEISRFIDTSLGSGTKVNKSNEGNNGSKESVGGFLRLDTLTVMRIVAMTILFFLVQILVRLYQYNLRLSAFWDSRVDAMFLKRSFAKEKAETFDDLVYALGPDAHDFKPAPKPMIDRLMPRSKS